MSARCEFTDNTVGLKSIAVALAIGIAAGGGGIGMGLATAKSAEGISRQPEAEGFIQCSRICCRSIFKGISSTCLTIRR